MVASNCALPKELRGYGTDTSPTFRTVARADSKPVEECLLEESSPDIGSEPIPSFHYTSHDYHHDEVKKIWQKSW